MRLENLVENSIKLKKNKNKKNKLSVKKYTQKFRFK